MKKELLNVAAALESVQRDLILMDPDDAEDELPEVAAQVGGIVVEISSLAQQAKD